MKSLLRKLGFGALVGLLCAQASLLAQTPPAIFVKMSTSQVASGTTPTSATTTTIAAPSAGWSFSAAAPIAGTTWNQILRPNPLIGSNNTSIVGQYVCNSANNISLSSATGQADAARLTISLDIRDLDPGSSRTEPNGSRGGDTELGPLGLMDTGWNIYRPGNLSVHKISGLKPGAPYLVYFYGSSQGTPGGGRFTLDRANVPDQGPDFVETSGSPSGNVFELKDGVCAPTKAAAPLTASTPDDSSTWGRLHAVADATGALTFRTGKNTSATHYLNGYQLVPFPRPVLAAQAPAELAVEEGAEAVLSVSATGEGPLSYSWRKNGEPIGGVPSASTPELRLAAVGADAAGTYHVVVSNPGGETSGTPVALRVSPRPRVIENLAPVAKAPAAPEGRPVAPKAERSARSWPVR